MARIYPLFSSSKGNAVYIGNTAQGILIDAGVSFRRLNAAMERAGLSLAAVHAVFITHAHCDHVAAVRMLLKQTDIPVYIQPETMREMELTPTPQVRTLTGSTEAAGMTVTPFATSHDTAQSCGYRITCTDGQSCAVCTDLGYVSETVRAAIGGCRLVLLEANYDPAMLANGSYPETVKARIRSERGHLSNEQSGETAAWLIGQGTAYIVLGHLSQENNRPGLAEQAIEAAAARAGFRRNEDYILTVAAPETDGRMIVF